MFLKFQLIKSKIKLRKPFQSKNLKFILSVLLFHLKVSFLILFGLHYWRKTFFKYPLTHITKCNCHLVLLESNLKSNFTAFHFHLYLKKYTILIMKMNGKVFFSGYFSLYFLIMRISSKIYECAKRKNQRMKDMHFRNSIYIFENLMFNKIAFWTISLENHSFFIQTINNFPVI